MSAPSRTILITGGTSDLGYYCALEVARQRPDYSVVLVSRTDPKSAATTINKTLAQKNVVFLPLDLSNLSKISTFVQHWESESHPPIQALLLNAGLPFPNDLRYTDDGIEATIWHQLCRLRSPLPPPLSSPGR